MNADPKNTKAGTKPADATDAACALYDTAAMLEVLRSHVRIMVSNGQLHEDLANPLTRVVALCRKRIEEVASVVNEWELAAPQGGAA